MGRRLLIIDDNRSVCAYLKDRLEAMGYTVIVAHDGRTGLALMALESKQAPIDGVLLDVHMPLMDGIQVLRALRLQHKTVPILVSRFGKRH
jgi:DNA-binding response OmpR family regulator